jgi:hypothetical protein
MVSAAYIRQVNPVDLQLTLLSPRSHGVTSRANGHIEVHHSKSFVMSSH